MCHLISVVSSYISGVLRNMKSSMLLVVALFISSFAVVAQAEDINLTVAAPEGSTSVRLTGPWWSWDAAAGPEATDVDGDGKLDISVANRYGTSVSVFRNNSSSGSFSTSSFSAAVDFSTGSGSEPHKLVHADVDGDGKLEMCVSNWNGGISVFQNTSSSGSRQVDRSF